MEVAQYLLYICLVCETSSRGVGGPSPSLHVLIWITLDLTIQPPVYNEICVHNRIQVNDYEVAICPLPGSRMGGARRSLVADLGRLLG